MMKHLAVASTALVTLSLGSAHAAGLDRSGQSVLAIFDDPNTLSFSISQTNPDVTGGDVNGPATYDAGRTFTQVTATYANAINDQYSYAVIYDQPFGSDVLYDANPLASALGGTQADLSSQAISFIMKYQATERVSVFGGLRFEEAGGRVVLNGRAYQAAIGAQALGAGLAATAAGLNPNASPADAATAQALLANLGTNASVALAGVALGDAAAAGATNTINSIASLAPLVGATNAFGATGGYQVDIDQDWGIGFTVGAAYEIPAIALRLAVTYHSEIQHATTGREQGLFLGLATPTAGQLTFDTPQSINIDVQGGINERTLLIAGLRWTDWDDFDVVPAAFGNDLADIDDGFTWRLGVARRFTENFVGLASMTYEKDPGSATVSPLGPSDGLLGFSLGGRYSSGNLNVSGGVNYSIVGSALPGVAGQPVALFEDNSALSVGFKVDYRF